MERHISLQILLVIDPSIFVPYVSPLHACLKISSILLIINHDIVVITGGSINSLGAETAICLASASPSTIVLLGRTESKITRVLEKIKRLNPSISALFIPIDFSSPSTIKNAAAQILRETSQIDVLMNSAGIMALPKYSTASMSPGHPIENLRCILPPTI